MPKGDREPSTRIAAACAELRRAIPQELESLKWVVDGLSDDLAPMYQREIKRLDALLSAATIKDRFFRVPEPEVHPRKYDHFLVLRDDLRSFRIFSK
jgi:hypothetical protein